MSSSETDAHAELDAGAGAVPDGQGAVLSPSTPGSAQSTLDNESDLPRSATSKGKQRAVSPASSTPDDADDGDDDAFDKLKRLLKARSTYDYTPCLINTTVQFIDEETGEPHWQCKLHLFTPTDDAAECAPDSCKRAARAYHKDSKEGPRTMMGDLQNHIAHRSNNEGRESLIIVRLYLSLTQDRFTSSIRVEMGGRAIEQQIEPLFGGANDALEFAAMSILSLLRNISSGDGQLDGHEMPGMAVLEGTEARVPDTITDPSDWGWQDRLQSLIESEAASESGLIMLIAPCSHHRSRLRILAQLISVVLVLTLWTVGTDSLRLRQHHFFELHKQDLAWYRAIDRKEWMVLCTLMAAGGVYLGRMR